MHLTPQKPAARPSKAGDGVLKMKTAYLLTKTDGETALLFDRVRAHGLAGHKGWLVRELTPTETKARVLAAFKDATGKTLTARP